MHIIRYTSRKEKAKDTANTLSIVHMKGLTSMEPINIVTELMECINAILDSLPKPPPVNGILALSDTPIYLQKHGRRSGFIFVLRPVTLNIDIPGIGQFLIALGTGWNDLSAPEGTRIALTSGKLSAFYRCTDALA